MRSSLINTVPMLDHLLETCLHESAFFECGFRVPKVQGVVSEPGKIEFFTKTDFFIIQVELEEVQGCPGGAHGPYEDIPSNFGRIWSYMGSESPLFNI